MSPRNLLGCCFGLFGVATALAQPAILAPGALPEGYQIAERGKDFAVIGKITAVTNKSGETVIVTNGYTLLENNLHYFEKGEWNLSEGEWTVARRGRCLRERLT